MGDVPWPATILTTSVLALLAAAVVRPVTAGPDATRTPPLRVGAALRALRAGPVRLVTCGYLGHMWELYASWAWLPAFFAASRHAVADPARLETGAIVFASVGVSGLAGAILAGRLADRAGRTATTSAAMVLSAACCLASPWAYGAPTVALVALLLVWARRSSRTRLSSPVDPARGRRNELALRPAAARGRATRRHRGMLRLRAVG